MRNARSKSTFRARSRQRVASRAGGVKHSIVKTITASSGSSTYDHEVLAWVNRLANVGGTATNDQIAAANTFIKTIKSVDGLRDKIKRLNLFCGSNFDSALVPLIADAGSDQDSNYNFSNSEYSSNSGIKNSTASGNKYLDTSMSFSDAGLSFTDGHLAVHTSGNNTSSSYKEWIGRDHAAIGSNKENRKFQFRWGDHLIYADNRNPQEGTCMGFYLGNCSSSKISLSLNNNTVSTKDISSNSPGNADLNQDFRIFKRNTVYTSPNDFDQTINFYSIGLSLTDEQAKGLYDAVAVFNHTLNRGHYDTEDSEVWKWANHRIAEAVGDLSTHFTALAVQNADAWMAKIKNNGLRNKISRANLFLGKTSDSYAYLSALVPLIIDSGNRTDTNYNFINSDFSLMSGFKGNGVSKYLDTGVKTSSLLNDLSAHISAQTSSPATNSISSNNINCLIGSRESLNTGGHGFSINLSKTEFFSKTVEENMRSTVPSSEGTFTLSVNSSSSVRQYYAGSFLKDISSVPASLVSFDTNGDRSLTLFTSNSESYSTTGFSQQSIKSYSIGSSLTDNEASILSKANSGVVRKELSASDTEVYNWANSIVPSFGGVLTQREVDSVNAWMVKIKSSSGLRDKIKRANLMVGSNLQAKLVPVISDVGSSKTDLNNNLSEQDWVSTGLKGGVGKSLNTTVQISDFLANNSGHFSVKNYADLTAIVDSRTFSHGVINSSSVKPTFGLTMDSSNVKGHMWSGELTQANVNSSSLTTLSTINMPAVNTASIASGMTTMVRVFAPYDRGRGTQVRESIWQNNHNIPYTSTINGDLYISIDSCFIARGEGYFTVLKNGNLVAASEASRGGHNSRGNTITPKFTIKDVAIGDKIEIRVVGQYNPNDPHGSFGYAHGWNYFVRCVETGDSPTAICTGDKADFNVTISQIVPSTTNSAKGLWTVSRVGQSESSMYLDGVLKDSSTTAVSSDIDNSGHTDLVHVMGSFSDDGSIKDFHDDSSRMGFYSLGQGLSSAEASVMSEAITAFDSSMERDLDEEVWDWGYRRLPDNGGNIDKTELSYIDTFMKAIKNESGLRESIRRLNLFIGSTTNSAMVPLIKDFGGLVDTNYNFVSNDVDQGVTGGNNKYLDTGIDSNDIPNFSMANFHVALSAKGTFPSETNGYALSNGIVRFNLTNAASKLQYGNNSITSSHNSGLLIGTSVDTNETKLYRGQPSTQAANTGPFEGTVSNNNTNFLIFGNVAESGITSGFNGRISIYSIGTGLSTGQVTAFNNALISLEGSLRRGDYDAKDEDAWKWANVNVPLNGGIVTQTEVTAVDKFMKSVNSIPNLRKSIKRMNLFVGQNLNAALVPVVSDLGATVDVNNNFDSDDYKSTGACAGLKSGLSALTEHSGNKCLDTTVKASEVLQNDWHISFRSPDGFDPNIASVASIPIMGCENGFNVRRFGGYLGKAGMTLASAIGQGCTIDHYYNYISDFRDLPYSYEGCSLNASIVGGFESDSSILESSCESSSGGQNSYGKIDSEKARNDRLYYEETIRETIQKTTMSYGDSAKSFILDHLDGTTDSVDSCKGFYSFVTSSTSAGIGAGQKIEIHKNGQKMAKSFYSNTYGAPDDTIAVFGVRNNSITPHPTSGRIVPTNQRITLNFYCFGTGPKTSGNKGSQHNPDVLTDNFSPKEMHAFLNTLDQDLDRKNHSVHSCNPLITSALDPEVSEWANERVPKAGGEISDSIVLAVDAWMKAVKSSPGLRDKIKRCNLFAGSNLKAALVPVISDQGFPVEINKGTLKFKESDYSIKGGLNANLSSPGVEAQKWLDTGMKASSPLAKRNGHIGFASAVSNFYSVYGASFPISLGYNLLDPVNNGGINIGIYQASQSGDQRLWINGTWGAPSSSGNWKVLPSASYSPNRTIFFSANGSNNTGRIYVGDGLLLDQMNSTQAFGTNELSADGVFTLFCQNHNRDSEHDRQGGNIIPSRSSLLQIGAHIYALTDEEYTLDNLISPSHGDKTKNVEKFIQDIYGIRWEPVTHAHIKSLWSDGDTDNDFAFSRLLQDLKHEYKYDKPIGWLDIENSSGEASDTIGSETRLLLHNDKQSNSTRGMNVLSVYNSDPSTNTIVRNINQYTFDKRCSSCGFEKPKAPILIRTNVTQGITGAPSDVKQKWGADVSYYSIGDYITQSEMAILNTAYKNFAIAMERPIQ